MAARKTNRVPLPSGPSGSEASAQQRQLIQRVATLEANTGTVEYEGVDLTSVVSGGDTSTSVTNQYTVNVTGGGGTYETNIILGTTGIATTHPTLPTTTYKYVAQPAYGTALINAVTADGYSPNLGVFDAYTGVWRPVGAMSAGYTATLPTYYSGFLGHSKLALTPDNSNIGNLRSYYYDDTPVYYGAGVSGKFYTTSTATSGMTTNHRFGIFDGSTVTDISDNLNHTNLLPILNNATLAYDYDTDYVVLGSSSSQVYVYGRVSYLGGASSSHRWVYFLIRVSASSLHAAWLSSGVVQNPADFATVIYESPQLPSASRPPGNIQISYPLNNFCASNLIGRTYAWTMDSTYLYRVTLATGAVTTYTLPSGHGILNHDYTGSDARNTGNITGFQVRSTDFGNTYDDFVGIRQALRTDGVTNELRLCRFGTYGVADITPADSGILLGTLQHSDLINSGLQSVPQFTPNGGTVIASEFTGGEPDYLTLYFDDGTINAGVQLIDLYYAVPPN